jgi:methyl-coenzyme M reductase subunit D
MVTIKSDTDSEPVQVEIFPSRFLSPETTQKLLNELYKSGGIVRMMIQGPNLPRTVTYGPGKGLPIEEHRNLLVEVGGEILELRVKVGRIRVELEGEEFLPGIQAACERALPFSFQIKRGKFFRDISTISDYAKYGKDADKRILGLVDPRAKKESALAILSEKDSDEKEER